MGYIAKVTFADLEDGKRIYLAGAKYPRDGLTVSDERLARLSGSDNLMGYPLIERVPDEESKPKEAPTSKTVSRKRVKKDA